MNYKFLFSLLIFSFFCSFYSTAFIVDSRYSSFQSNRENEYKIQKNFKDDLCLLKDFFYLTQSMVCALALCYLSCFVHECSHAVVAKFVDPNCTVQVHMNPFEQWVWQSYPFNKREKDLLFKIGNIYFHKGNPIGHHFTRYFNFSSSKVGEILMSLAGGLGGSCVICLALFIRAFRQEYEKTGNIKLSLYFGLKDAFFPFKNLLHKKNLTRMGIISELLFISTLLIFGLTQIIYTFCPVDSNGDGTEVWKKFLNGNVPTIPLALIALPIAALLFIKSIKTYKKYFKDRRLDINYEF